MNVHPARAFRSPAELADAAAEAVRSLNHATFRGETRGYRWPSDVDSTIGNLLVLVERLPQALAQAQRWLDGEHAAGRVGHDTDPTRAAQAIEDVALALIDAQTELELAAHALRTAREASSHLTGCPDAHDTPDETADGGAR